MGRVSGQVTQDGTNTPVADAHVFVVHAGEFSTSAGPPPATVTDQDGRYRFDNLPAGRYYIGAEKSGFAPPMAPSTTQVLEVAAGQNLDGRPVLLRRGGVI